MLIITSTLYGQIIIPFIQRQKESFSSNIPMYARDNSLTKNNDTVTSGAVIKPAIISLNGIINSNIGGLASGLLSSFNIGQIRQQLIGIRDASLLVSIVFNQSSNPLIFGENPLTYNNVTIQDMDFQADETTGNAYELDITFVEQIIVNTISNPEIINVPANQSGSASGASHSSSTNVQKTSLNPQNNGTITPQVAGALFEQAIENLWSDL